MIAYRKTKYYPKVILRNPNGTRTFINLLFGKFNPYKLWQYHFLNGVLALAKVSFTNREKIPEQHSIFVQLFANRQKKSY